MAISATAEKNGQFVLLWNPELLFSQSNVFLKDRVTIQETVKCLEVLDRAKVVECRFHQKDDVSVNYQLLSIAFNLLEAIGLKPVEFRLIKR